jgi:antibiotic biosynthesis monooxygenase (ABM) superfamily enzyme
MNSSASATPSLIYYRLIALWVLCEALLGSIIFTFRIPVSGLIIGSCAVICISLLAWYVPAKGAIIRATLIVAIFKMMLSPQAPPPAYLAVFFQGLMGELLFWNRKYFRLFCVILALLAMVESAFQRVLSITIIYGNDFWTALNSFIKKLTGSEQITDYSYFIIFWYVLIHIIAGILLGAWIGFLPQRIQLMSSFQKKYSVETIHTAITVPQRKRKRKRKFRLFLFVIWILFIAIYIQSYFKIGPALLPSAMVLRILIRSVIIVLTWYFLISPALKQWLHKWLQRKKQQSGEQVQQVLNLLPSTQGLMLRSWQLAAGRRGWRRIVLCCKIILANTFYTPES